MKDIVNKLTKKELILILETILIDHPEYFNLLNSKKIKNTEDFKSVTQAIEKEMANHTGSLFKAYQVYKNYKTNNSKSKSFMKVAFEFVEYLFEEIDAYGGEPSEELLEITLEVFEDACHLATKYNEASMINRLNDSLHSAIYNEDIIDEFHDIMSYFGAFELLDD